MHSPEGWTLSGGTSMDLDQRQRLTPRRNRTVFSVQQPQLRFGASDCLAVPVLVQIIRVGSLMIKTKKHVQSRFNLELFF